jgi:hypothetical protein
MPATQAIQVGDEQALLAHLPEVRRLADLTERNDWHDDSPLAQSLRLFRWVQQLPASLRETANPAESSVQFQLACLVDPAQGQYTTRELLAFAALIHDAGKASTYQRRPDGTTRCSGHEAASGRLAPGICARFDLTPSETNFVTTLVGAHGKPYELFKAQRARPPEARQRAMAGLAARYGEHFLPLLLLAWGDLVTSHLDSRCAGKYQAVLAFYRRLLPLALDGR